MTQTNHEGSLNYKWKTMCSKPMELQMKMENKFIAHGAKHGENIESHWGWKIRYKFYNYGLLNGKHIKYHLATH